MGRRALLLAPFLFAAKAEAAGVHLTGTLGGPDTDVGYFELVNDVGKGEQDLVLATPIDSALFPNFKAMTGRKVQVSVFTTS